MSNIIENLLSRVQNFEANINKYIREEIEDIEPFICDMNAQNQLYELGVNSDNKKIADYAPYTSTTIAIKRLKGQPTNRVTLRDSGDFHASFFLDIDDYKFFIDATDDKVNKLAFKYGENIFGLTDSNINELTWEYIYPMLLDKIKNL